MIIGNAKVYMDGNFRDGSVTIEKDKITAIGEANIPCDVDAKGMYLVPGFLDVHTHGAMNEDFSDGKWSGLQKMSRYYAANGVTAFLATTMTLKEETLTPAMEAIRDFVRPEDGAKCAGIHLEGPFLSYAKRGAQAAENLHAPDAEMFRRLNDASGNHVRLVTVAPEEPGALEFIREVSKVCTVSLGHTTADYDTAVAAYEAGATHATHLFNGMPAFGHRAPGVVGAAFDKGATAELICDGLHIHPSVIRVAHRLFGKNLVVISDSLRCAGMPDGQYELGGQPIEMKHGKATLLGSETLAGSSTNLLEEVRNLVGFGIPLADAIYAVTQAPAKAVGLDHQIGRIAVGLQADLLLLNEDLALHSVYIDGKQVSL
ncbi:MAG: N-acetylglucosamine-6-phosphate deacetylase [Oscillospiraceae bacterium]|nr:N-acetylglucosamine-6-phosphate deacetylase [Oscillospiraceae bacterium]